MKAFAKFTVLATVMSALTMAQTLGDPTDLPLGLAFTRDYNTDFCMTKVVTDDQARTSLNVDCGVQAPS